MAAPAILADASRVRSLRWWPDAALMGAAARLRRTLEPWAASWGLSLRDVQARNAAAVKAVSAGAEGHALGASAMRSWIVRDQPVATLAALLFDHAPAGARGGQGLSGELAAQAWQDLVDALVASLPAVDTAFAERADGAGPTERSWSGAVLIDFTVQGADAPSSFTLRLDAMHAAAWCAATPVPATAQAAPARAALVSVPEVVEGRPARLSVHLAAVELDLGTLQSLAVGDVIRLPHRLADPAHVRVDMGDASTHTLPCGAHLAQRGGRLVAELVPEPPAR